MLPEPSRFNRFREMLMLKKVTAVAALIGVVCLFLQACSQGPELPEIKETVSPAPPVWAKDAIWYQIFVERFNNGDSSNDPTKQSIEGAYPGFVPDNWELSPWTQDWYKADAYFNNVHAKADFTGKPVVDFDAKTALRRYGGDLQGVINKLDYIADLGVTALYFNPLNDAPSLHKYDARHWRHIDVNFGPDPQGDIDIINGEDPADPSTWQFTSADKLFLKLLEQAKSRGIRVILDYSWNHTGHTFWAWQDVLKNQKSSEYADWYWIKQFDDPETSENEFEYRGWFGVYDLPEIKETVYAEHAEKVTLTEGNIYSEAAKNHIFYVTQRWLDPNGDGDPSDGVDGYRLDVAAEMPLGFWREYRRFVKTINPEAYLIGEIWWEQYPDDLFNPEPVLQGDVFDAVMNYRWYRAARHFFAGAPNELSPLAFADKLASLSKNINSANNLAMMNMSASHDSPRLLTSMFNSNKYKFNAKAAQNSRYKTSKPDAKAMNNAKLLLAHQFTYIGAPQIWAGDEMGMWGSDDPHNRKPLTWPEMHFDDESSHPSSIYNTTSKVGFNAELFTYYQSLISMRKNHPVLIDGNIDFSVIDNANSLFAYTRGGEYEEKAFVAFNKSSKPQTLVVPSNIVGVKSWQVWQSNAIELVPAIPAETIILDQHSAFIIFAK